MTEKQLYFLSTYTSTTRATLSKDESNRLSRTSACMVWDKCMKKKAIMFVCTEQFTDKILYKTVKPVNVEMSVRNTD